MIAHGRFSKSYEHRVGAFLVGSGRFLDSGRFGGSIRGVWGPTGALFIRVKAIFAQIGAFWVDLSMF